MTGICGQPERPQRRFVVRGAKSVSSRLRSAKARIGYLDIVDYMLR
jgi:hypothetical protein